MSVTSEPVRARIWALTRSMSGATSSVSRSIVAWGLSNGTMTATAHAPILLRAGEPPRPTGQRISIKTPRKPDKGAVAAAAIDLKSSAPALPAGRLLRQSTSMAIWGSIRSIHRSAQPTGRHGRQEGDMRELVRTNDPVLVSAIEALLDGAGIPHMTLDQNMSVLEGS